MNRDQDPSDASEFEVAAQHVTRLAFEGRLSDADLLSLYASYKQATVGPCNTPRPGIFSLAARRKWDAWQALGDMASSAGAQRYVETLSRLQPDWRKAGEQSASSATGPHGPGAPVQTLRCDSGDASASFLRGLGISVSTPQRDVNAEPATDSPWDLVKSGRADALEQLPHSHVAWRATDEDGLTLLHWAADRGHARLVDLLVARGADVHARDAHGQTALHYAASCQHGEAARALLRAGADPRAVDGDGVTPSELAADLHGMMTQPVMSEQL